MEKLNFAVFVILFGVNIFICSAFYTGEKIDVDKAVEYYNSIPGLPWKAGKNGLGKTIKISQIKSKLGWIPKQEKIEYESSSHDHEDTEDDDLPKNYDCRAAYPDCTTISSIKDQSNCGSCWAVSVAATFSDRICIHSKGRENFNMSADQLLACDKKSKGCDGGYLDTAWGYIEDNGLVTGGDYGSNEGCWPYSIPPDQSSSGSSAKTPECKNVSCPVSFKAKKKSTTLIKSMERLIREEIYKNGPVSTGFYVFLSFNFYKSGIYERPWFDFIFLGGHAVRVIGWGEEKGKKYWLVANSWGKKWGENGTFRIRRGTDECKFESEMIAGLPLLQ